VVRCVGYHTLLSLKSNQFFLLYYWNMELSERCMKTLENEGFASVFEWTDPARTEYPEHAHEGKVSLFVTDGSITFDFEGTLKVLKAGDRFDVPTGKLHSAIVGDRGWVVVVGEEFEEGP
jgi:quercetin dioxygenase-like cupin family protein